MLNRNLNATASDDKYCVVIPAYMEEGRIGRVLNEVRKFCPDVVVIDDGSSDDTSGEAAKAGAVVIRHDVNQGKGVSLNDGFRHAVTSGFQYVITMDADGQHDPADLSAFLDASAVPGVDVLIGNRMADSGRMPWVRRLTNRFMSRLLSRKMGQRVPDTQCGYRLYRCETLAGVMVKSGRFAAESEILLLLAANGVRIASVPVKVIYSDERSKINPLRDALRFFAMLNAFDRR